MWPRCYYHWGLTLQGCSPVFLQGPSSPRSKTQPGLNQNQFAMIKTYLDIQDDVNAESNLHRYFNSDQDVSQMCEVHAQQHLEHEALKRLKRFVQFHAGQINMQQATLNAGLGSITDVDQACTLLAGAKHPFDTSIKLCWRATQSEVHKLYLGIMQTNTASLQLNGITLDIHPEGHVQYIWNLFDNIFLKILKVKFLMLLDYPQPHQQCFNFRKVLLQMSLPPWSELNW